MMGVVFLLAWRKFQEQLAAMKLQQKYILAACLVKIYDLQSVDFDMEASCHSFSPCLMLKSPVNITSVTHSKFLQLPLHYALEDGWLKKCTIDLSLQIEALALNEVVQLNNR